MSSISFDQEQQQQLHQQPLQQQTTTTTSTLTTSTLREGDKEIAKPKVLVADKIEATTTEPQKGIIQTVKDKIFGSGEAMTEEKDKLQPHEKVVGDIKPEDLPVSPDKPPQLAPQEKGIGQKIKESVTGTLDKMMHALSLSTEKTEAEVQVPPPAPPPPTTWEVKPVGITPTMDLRKPETSTTEKIGQKAQEAKEQMTQIKDQVVDKTYQSADYLKEKGIQAKDKIAETYSQVKDKAAGAIEQAKEKIAEQTKDKATPPLSTPATIAPPQNELGLTKKDKLDFQVHHSTEKFTPSSTTLPTTAASKDKLDFQVHQNKDKAIPSWPTSDSTLTSNLPPSAPATNLPVGSTAPTAAVTKDEFGGFTREQVTTAKDAQGTLHKDKTQTKDRDIHAKDQAKHKQHEGKKGGFTPSLA